MGTHDVVQKTYWNVNLDSFTGPNGTTDTTGYMAAIDSGTSLIMGPNSIITPLIDGIKVHRLCRGIEDLPDITFTMDGIDYVLTWEDYVVRLLRTTRPSASWELPELISQTTSS